MLLAGCKHNVQPEPSRNSTSKLLSRYVGLCLLCKALPFTAWDQKHQTVIHLIIIVAKSCTGSTQVPLWRQCTQQLQRPRGAKAHHTAGSISLSSVRDAALHTQHALLCLCSECATAGRQNAAGRSRSSCTWHTRHEPWPEGPLREEPKCGRCPAVLKMASITLLSYPIFLLSEPTSIGPAHQLSLYV